MTAHVPLVNPHELVLKAERLMRDMPQEELVTTHFFADGMYARVVGRRAGVLIVGKVHKREHLYIVAKGRVKVVGPSGPVEYGAGSVIVSKPGTKRMVLAMEDSICLTVHRTDKTDLDEIEKELIEDDEDALYDAHNRLKRSQ